MLKCCVFLFFFLYISATVSINRKEGNSCDFSMSQHVLSGSSGLRITFLILRKRNCHSERFNMCYAIIKITRIKIDEATAQVSRAVCVGGESIYLFSLCCLFNSNRFSTVQLTRCILLTQYKENDPNSILHRQRICLHFTKGDEKVDYDLNKCHSQPTLLPFFRFSLYRINT